MRLHQKYRQPVATVDRLMAIVPVVQQKMRATRVLALSPARLNRLTWPRPVPVGALLQTRRDSFLVAPLTIQALSVGRQLRQAYPLLAQSRRHVHRPRGLRQRLGAPSALAFAPLDPAMLR